ncbi:MAG: hypothetical protein QF535_17710 [Anaerolineales bacterium]|jgi:hypothetical protein|nr:hypothetical protein [Anaerolineales bacterium]
MAINLHRWCLQAIAGATDASLSSQQEIQLGSLYKTFSGMTQRQIVVFAFARNSDSSWASF